jgi:signal transduction histidine kinase/FixJ family two-component response regulator
MSDSQVRILIVDDDEDDFIIARDLFWEIDRSAYAIDWAESYDAAFRKMAEDRYDVFLIDYRLGAHSGLELLKEAKRQGYDAPMVLLTGQGDHDVDLQAMRAGAADFLVKGQINAQSVERSIRYALERKRAETEIQKLAAFPRCNPNPVLEFAADGTLTYFNSAARAVAESLGKESPHDILPPDTRPIVADRLTTGEPQTDLQTQSDGRTFSWSFIPIPTSRVVHCYATEITERLSLEAQLRHSVKMQAVGQLAAGIAHDFNNILTVIQGHANLLLTPSKTGLLPEASIRQITLGAERAGNLIRQLLTFSRQQGIQPYPLDLNEVICSLTNMMERLLGEHISLKPELAPILPAVLADPGMIEQILMNLAVNARDAMPKGGLLVITTSVVEFNESNLPTQPEARIGQFVCLSVGDTGCGIAADVLDHIFEPFFSTKEAGKGTGLGLATVYGIVKQHEGWIDVESQVSVGTTFRIYLPASTLSARSATGSDTEYFSVAGGNETILVVEDEPALRELVAQILTEYGYRVLSAASAWEALSIWEQEAGRVALLLTDVVMPQGLSGPDLAFRLRCEVPNLKVLYTSGYSTDVTGSDLTLTEGTNFLRKPYRPVRLARIVRECLDRKDEPAETVAPSGLDGPAPPATPTEPTPPPSEA